MMQDMHTSKQTICCNSKIIKNISAISVLRPRLLRNSEKCPKFIMLLLCTSQLLSSNSASVFKRQEFFSSLPCPEQHWTYSQPPIQWVPRPLSPETKQPKHKADQSDTPSAEIKNVCSITSTSPCTFIISFHNVMLKVYFKLIQKEDTCP